MKQRNKRALLICVIMACLGYLFIYGTDIPISLHERTHIIAHKLFTGESCNMTSIRTPEEDNFLHESYTWQVQCFKSGSTSQEHFIKLSAFTFETIIAVILVLTPLSLFGGFWFMRLASIFLFSNLVAPSDLEHINPPLIRLIGLAFILLFIVSFWIQWKWVNYVLSRYEKKSHKHRFGKTFIPLL
ncbi:MAG: hypothetical protein V1859_02160 [archaeon]